VNTSTAIAKRLAILAHGRQRRALYTEARRQLQELDNAGMLANVFKVHVFGDYTDLMKDAPETLWLSLHARNVTPEQRAYESEVFVFNDSAPDAACAEDMHELFYGLKASAGPPLLVFGEEQDAPLYTFSPAL
jgi:hypothetical protein